jgi:hypothetical protein
VVAGLLLAVAVGSAAPTGETGIVVLGRRARNVQVVFERGESGRLSACRVIRTSGDAEVDELWCIALDRCATSWSVSAPKVKSCARRERRVLLAALAEKREREGKH